MNWAVCAVAAVVRHPENERAFLAVKRPEQDDSLPGLWGLPAVTLRPGELPEQGLRRIGREKLHAEIEPVQLIGLKTGSQGERELVLMDIEARLVGAQPAVGEAVTDGTRYVDQQWSEDYGVLCAAARRGSLCSQILLEARDLRY